MAALRLRSTVILASSLIERLCGNELRLDALPVTTIDLNLLPMQEILTLVIAPQLLSTTTTDLFTIFVWPIFIFSVMCCAL